MMISQLTKKGKIMAILHTQLLAPTKTGYSILFEALEEDTPIEDALSFEATGVDHSDFIDKVHTGDAVWFMAKITVFKSASKAGDAYLGCCGYSSFEEFLTSSDYLPQMISDALEEAEG